MQRRLYGWALILFGLVCVGVGLWLLASGIAMLRM